MGLLPIEFTDCLSDSPYFRENLHAHERELDQTSSQIKQLIREVKELVSAAKTLSRAQRNLASSLSNFTFECIGGSQTDDEIIISGSLKEFGRLLNSIEDERDRMLERANSSFIDPIDKFRRDHIGGVKEGKKKFDKETTRFCQSLERHLNLSTKKSENHLQEADASLGMEQRYFMKASLEYVLKLQEVQERKKFEFVETILSFMYGWLTFYHQGHEVAKEFKNFMLDLQVRLQRTRENYNATQDEAEHLMKKMLEDKSTRNIKNQDPGSLNKMYTRQGYLFLMEKKAFGTTWVKTFCQYQKEDRRFIMIPYNQTLGKISSTETITLKECIRRMSDSIEKRFCFDVVSDNQVTYTLQALSEEDRKLWLEAMEAISSNHKLNSSQAISANMAAHGTLPPALKEEYVLDEFGLQFVKALIERIEHSGLDDQGIYRVSGVSSKIQRLMKLYSDAHKNLLMSGDSYSKETGSQSSEPVLCKQKISIAMNNLMSEFEGNELKNLTSALKNYLRNLPEPLMTFRLHSGFISAAKIEFKEQRINAVHELVHRLPKLNFALAHVLFRHLTDVAARSQKNLMSVCNLGVCFGPTLLRPEEESVAAIMSIKFCNVVVEILIENCEKIFTTKPVGFDPSRMSAVPHNYIHSMHVPHNHGLPINSGNNAGAQFGVLARPPSNPQFLANASLQAGTNVPPQYREVIRTNPRFTGYPPTLPPTAMPVTVAKNVAGFPGGGSVGIAGTYNATTTTAALPPPSLSFSSFASQSLNSSPILIESQKSQHHPSINHRSANVYGNVYPNLSSPNIANQASIGSQAPSLHLQLQPPGSGLFTVGLSNQSNITLPQNGPNTAQNHSNLTAGAPSNLAVGGNSFASSPSSNFYVPFQAHGSTSSSNQMITGSSSGISTSGNPSIGKPLQSTTSSSPNSSSSSTSAQMLQQQQQQKLSSSGVYQEGQSSSVPNLQQVLQPGPGRTVRSLYPCFGRGLQELTFETNALLTNVRPSREPGWLEGTYNGKFGLIPENYVQYVD